MNEWRKNVLVGLAIASSSAALIHAEPAQSDATLNVRITPESAEGKVVAIRIREEISSPSIPAGRRFLTMPMQLESIPGVLSDPSTLKASDATGPLPLVMSEDPPSADEFHQERHWSPARATNGTIVVTYVATPRAVTPKTPPGPLNDVRTEGSGIYGTTALLLALPDADWPRRVTLHWSLNNLAPGARVASSFGEGDTTTVLGRGQAQAGYFMAGPLFRLPPNGESKFTVYYLTPPKFDLDKAAAFTAATYNYAGKFFHDSSKPFRVFMRTTDRFQGGGGGGYQSFMFGNVKGQDRNLDEVQHLMAHEAIHNWISSFGSGYAGKWFIEGGTEYYSTIIPRRAGLSSVAEFGKQINDWARDYYTNPRRTMSDTEATKMFLSDGSAQLLPYQRGPLYIAQVDARLRAASGGRRRVDELVRPMVQAIQEGNANEALWAKLIAKALGPRGAADYAAFKAGKLLVLPSNLFGACFRSKTVTYRAFDAGFRIEPDPDGTYHARYISTGQAGSLAGLIDGDEIENHSAFAEARMHEGQPFTLHVKRGGVPLDLKVDPWGSPAQGLQWLRTATPEALCDL